MGVYRGHIAMEKKMETTMVQFSDSSERSGKA